jgi:hypothetical protein
MVDKGEAFAEKAFEPIVILFTKGPVAFWDYIKEQLEEIIQSSFDRIKESVFLAFVKKGILWIAGFFVPGGGFVKIVKAIVRAFQFVAENLERIRLFFDAVFDSMEAATQGNPAGVASKIVTGLKMGIALALGFLARQLGLNAIIDSVHKILHALRRPIVNAIEWILRKIKPLVDKIVRSVTRVAGRVGERIAEWWAERTPFRARTGEEHTIFFEGKDANARLMIATAPIDYLAFVNRLNATTPAAVTAKNNAINAANGITNVRSSTTMSAAQKRTAIRANVRRIVRETGELLFLCGPGSNTYPGSGLDPATRSTIQLWEDLLPNPIPGGTETATQIGQRRMMARGLLFRRYVGAARDIATQIERHNFGRDMRPFDVQRNEREHVAAGAHVLDRHVLNRRGAIKSTRDLALRALLNVPQTTNFTASAFSSVADANAAIQHGIAQHVASNWPAFRDHLIATAPGTNVTPAAVAAGGPSVEIWRNRRNTVLLESELPVYLRGYSYANVTISNAAVGTRPLYTGDPNPGLSGQPLAVRGAFSGNMQIFLHSHRTAIGGYWVRTAYPIV